MLKHIISIKDFDNNLLTKFLSDCQHFEEVNHVQFKSPKILATLFFEASTRTRLSFESAMLRLGGQCLGFSDGSNSSIQKGETIWDTIRTIEAYADCIVVRHNIEGTAKLASMATKMGVPIINAGDGSNSHITQHLVDLYSIYRKFGRLNNLKIAYTGDLKYGRTVKGLAQALSMFPFNSHYFLPADPGLQIDWIGDLNAPPKLEEIIEDIDILYVTRLQKERFPDPQEFNRIIREYRITCETLKRAKKELIVLHPLPRNSEIAKEVDDTPHAYYFEQAHHGVTVRKCLLYSLIHLGGIK